VHRTFFSYSFGCRVNEAEKQLIDRTLLDAGFSWDEKKPTFYIINSCAVTGKAEREVRQHVYQIRKKFPETKIIATGCSATLWMKNNALLKEVDYWIDNRKKLSIHELLISLSKQQSKDATKKYSDKFINAGRMIVKIQDGCDWSCSYCIVPLLRQPVKSEKISDIIKLIRNNKLPISEVVLTAINTRLFGRETGETLTQLLNMILVRTKIERVSFGSIHPSSITPEFLIWYKKNKDNPRFVHFFHIPVQSGSDTVLKRMNRRYTTRKILNTLEQLHHVDPHALIATDVIVGFPGETEKEFQETYEFLKKSPISKFHVFRYSPRLGTVAINLLNELTYQVKKERSKKLIELSERKMKITT
jgi:threonylcarbamoyladenosine tRNA methylthiotransferase MtaB